MDTQSQSCDQQKISTPFSWENKFIYNFFNNAKNRARSKNVPFDLTHEYIRSIMTTHCPVFGIEFVWQSSKMGKGYTNPNSPSLDRVIPEYGYVQGNMVFISHLANKIKQDATEKELYAVADWLHDKRKEVLNALKDKHTPVPGTGNTPSLEPAARWPFPGTRPGKNSDSPDYYQGELVWADPNNCA
jgi:hypothetical protein